MTREKFIKKWLGNRNYEYTESNKELMREDLDNVIEYTKEAKNINLLNVADVSKRSELLTPLQPNECENCGVLIDKRLHYCSDCGR